jgi:hypothetical protein
VIAGAIAASALSFVLFTFGSALGIALASSSPSWRDASVALAVLSGLYVVLVTIASFGFGGYIAGRLRSRWAASTDTDEVEFGDGVHGPLGLGTGLGSRSLARLRSGSHGRRYLGSGCKPSKHDSGRADHSLRPRSFHSRLHPHPLT